MKQERRRKNTLGLLNAATGSKYKVELNKKGRIDSKIYGKKQIVKAKQTIKKQKKRGNKKEREPIHIYHPLNL